MKVQAVAGTQASSPASYIAESLRNQQSRTPALPATTLLVTPSRLLRISGARLSRQDCFHVHVRKQHVARLHRALHLPFRISSRNNYFRLDTLYSRQICAVVEMLSLTLLTPFISLPSNQLVSLSVISTTRVPSRPSFWPGK